MQNGYNQGSESWTRWLEIGDTSIIQSNLNDGTSASLVAVNESIKCDASPDLWTQILDFVWNYVFVSPEATG